MYGLGSTFYSFEFWVYQTVPLVNGERIQKLKKYGSIDKPVTWQWSFQRRQPSSSPEDFLMTTDRSTETEVVTVTRDRSPVLMEAAYLLGDCPICLEILGTREVAATICGHCFCHECIRQHFKTSLCCPSCRKLLHARHIIPLYLQQNY